MTGCTVARYGSAVGGRKLGPIRTVFSLGWERRKDGEEGAGGDGCAGVSPHKGSQGEILQAGGQIGSEMWGLAEL